MKYLLEIIKGTIIGIANVIPGLSGGTIAIILKIYDKIIDAVNDVIKHPIKVIKGIIFIALGVILGIVTSVFGVTYFYENFPVPTTFLFLGFVLGGIPLILKEVNYKKINYKKILCFLIFFILIIILPFFTSSSKSVAEFNIVNFISLFTIGVIGSATMVIPGVSGSMVLMCFGYYDSIMNLIKDVIKNFLELNISQFINSLLLLSPFIIGFVIGVFLIAKLIKYLLLKHRELAFCAVLGLIIASPFGILYQIDSFSIGIIETIITIILFAVGLFIPYLLEEKLSIDNKNENE